MTKRVGKEKPEVEAKLPKKSTKELVKTKQRSPKVTRKGWKDEPNDNPNGKEDFNTLLNAMIKPRK